MDERLRDDVFSESIELMGQDETRKNPVYALEPKESYDRGEATRSLCLLTVALSIAAGITCISLGATIFKDAEPDDELTRYHRDSAWPHNWVEISVSPVTGEVLPLVLNAIMTVLLDGLGFVHATTLRWALGDKLTFNANLRLFTSSRSCIALSGPANFFYALSLILCYTSTSLFFANRPPPEFCETHDGLSNPEGCGNDVHISPPALYTLGAGLLGQCALASWQFISVKVRSWSANPLDTAWATAVAEHRLRRQDRSMLSVHEAMQPPGPTTPKLLQRSIWSCHREARWIMRYIWLALGVSVTFFATIVGVIEANVARVKEQGCNGCGTYTGPSWNILPDYGGEATSTAVIEEQSPSVYAGLFIIIFLITGVVTIALHCAELITLLIRDETTWRHCNSKEPYLARQNSAIRAATSWPYIVLFILKVVLHWISGKGVTYVYNWGIFLRPPQLLYLAVGMALMAAFATMLCFQKLKGPQPATFGHVQTLMDLVDEWSLLMFWGDKGLRAEGGEIRHAGTANVCLQPVLLDAWYE